MKKIPMDLLQGTLDLLVLKTLQSGPTHGSRHRTAHPAGLARCPTCRPGIALPGTPPAGGRGLDQLRMGGVGK
jgi:hypothetical protein